MCGPMSEDVNEKECHTLISAGVTTVRQLPQSPGNVGTSTGSGENSLQTMVLFRPNKFICVNNGWSESRESISIPSVRMLVSLMWNVVYFNFMMLLSLGCRLIRNVWRIIFVNYLFIKFSLKTFTK